MDIAFRSLPDQTGHAQGQSGADYSDVVSAKLSGYEIFDFHSLRHTHATELCENGVNLKEIQRRLGHKNLEVTNRVYLHATDAMERESVEILKRMYGMGT